MKSILFLAHALIAVLALISSPQTAAANDSHPYFQQCEAFLAGHDPMDEDYIRQKVGASLAHWRDLTLNSNAAPKGRAKPDYEKLKKLFPDLHSTLKKAPDYLWLEAWAHNGGMAIQDFARGIEWRNKKYAEEADVSLEELSPELVAELERAFVVDTSVKRPSDHMSAMAMTPFRSNDSFSSESWYRGFTGRSSFYSVEGVFPEDYMHYLPSISEKPGVDLSQNSEESISDLQTRRNSKWLPNLITDSHRGIADRLPDLSLNLESLLNLLNDGGSLMLYLSQRYTKIVDSNGDPVEIIDYLSMIEGAKLIPWSSNNPDTKNSYHIKTTGNPVRAPELELIYWDYKGFMAERVYALKSSATK